MSKKEREINNKGNINYIPEKKGKNIIFTIKSKNGIRKKEYNIETPLNQILTDYKNENNLNEDNIIEFTYNNSLFHIDSRLLRSIITEEEQDEILIEQKIMKLKSFDELKNVEPINFIGRPMANPFEIYIYDISKKIIKRVKYAKEKVDNLELDKFGINSAFCNGVNHLFISGGVDPKTNEDINLFWDIDIENNKLKGKIKMPLPKKNHNMIYYNKGVYIIGGEDKKSFYYNIENMEIMNMPELNVEKYEPSLIIHNENIFSLDSSGKYFSEYNIEKLDLSRTDSVWEIVKPKKNQDILYSNFSQRFFGLVKDKNENFIFLGGINDNNKPNLDFLFHFNVKKNLIEKSDQLNVIGINNIKHIKLKEKSFIPLDENTSIIFPDFKRRAPAILYYYKDVNTLEFKMYHSNKGLTKLYTNKKKKQLKKSIERINMIKNDIIEEKKSSIIKTSNNNKNNDYNFKGEGGKKKENNNEDNKIPDILNNNINIWKKSFAINNDDKEKEIELINDLNKAKDKDIGNINNNLKEKEENKEIELIKSEEKKSQKPEPDTEEIKCEEDKKSNSDNPQQESNEIKNEKNKISEPIKVDIDNQKDNKEDLKSESKEQIKEDIDNKKDNNEDLKSESKEQIKEDIDNQKDNREDLKSESKEQIKEDIDNKKDNNKDLKSESKEQIKEDIDNKKDNNEDLKSESKESRKTEIDNKKDNNEDLKSESNEQIKTEIDNQKEKNKIKGNKADEDRNNNKIFRTSEVEEAKYKEFNTEPKYFHSSVNYNVMNNFSKLENNRAINNKIKMKYMYQPKEIDIKILKKERNKFSNFDFNDSDEFSNY